MDRASDYGSEGWGFKSLQARKMAKEEPRAEIYLRGVVYFEADSLFDCCLTHCAQMDIITATLPLGALE